MKIKVLFAIVFCLFVVNVFAIEPSKQHEKTKITKLEIINTDSVLGAMLGDTVPVIPIVKPQLAAKTEIATTQIKYITAQKTDSVNLVPAATSALPGINKDSLAHLNLVLRKDQQRADSLLILGNPLLIDLVYTGLPYDFKWDIKPDFRVLYYGQESAPLSKATMKPIKPETTEKIIADLRQGARDEITRTAFYLYDTMFDDLPSPDVNKSKFIKDKHLTKVKFIDDDAEFSHYHRKLIVKPERIGPWQYKATALAQFSENVISGNWYQGGNSNVAILGILTGQMNYDDKKKIQWDNSGEWHMGFNSVAGDSLHALSTNDDVFKATSKLGIKASGNFYYSASVDFSTQFFNSYNGVNSNVLKTSFLTPVRLNVGLGLDYKYKKIFSLMVSPVSFKYIYMNDNTHVDPNLFGITAGKNSLSEVGSSLTSTLSYAMSHEIQLDSKMSFYTNYQSVQVDWEMVCNLTINRFLSTRISINPRFDNTVIQTDGSKAKIQFKQFLSVGFSHKFQ